MFECEFVGKFTTESAVKEFWKSVNTYGSYGKSLVSSFFDLWCTLDWQINIYLKSPASCKIFLYGQCERLFATELNNKYFIRQIS